MGVATPCVSHASAMASYAVFFIDSAAIGLQRMEAADAVAAEGMVLDQRLSFTVDRFPGATSNS